MADTTPIPQGMRGQKAQHAYTMGMELSPSSKYVARGSETVSDADREALEQRLADAFAQGDMTQDRYLTLLDKLYAAKTLGDLAPVAQALPDGTTHVPAIVETGSGAPGELAPIATNALRPVVVAGSIVGALIVVLVVLVLLL